MHHEREVEDPQELKRGHISRIFIGEAAFGAYTSFMAPCLNSILAINRFPSSHESGVLRIPQQPEH